LGRTLALAYSFDTIKENTIRWKTKEKNSENNRKEKRNFTREREREREKAETYNGLHYALIA
jgi:hypothetical protein